MVRASYVRINTEVLQPGGGEGGGEERRGLGPRNDVLTTCKAITLRDGQRITAAFFPDFLEGRREPVKEIRNA